MCRAVVLDPTSVGLRDAKGRYRSARQACPGTRLRLIELHLTFQTQLTFCHAFIPS
jgi:hypothetical protein